MLELGRILLKEKKKQENIAKKLVMMAPKTSKMEEYWQINLLDDLSGSSPTIIMGKQSDLVILVTKT